jgi:hypothetical protein
MERATESVDMQNGSSGNQDNVAKAIELLLVVWGRVQNSAHFASRSSPTNITLSLVLFLFLFSFPA